MAKQLGSYKGTKLYEGENLTQRIREIDAGSAGSPPSPIPGKPYTIEGKEGDPSIPGYYYEQGGKTPGTTIRYDAAGNVVSSSPGALQEAKNQTEPQAQLPPPNLVSPPQVDTSRPSPSTIKVGETQASPAAIAAFEQAQGTFGKIQESFQRMKASGQAAPATSADGRAAVSAALPPAAAPDPITDLVSADPVLSSLMEQVQEYMNPKNQKKSLVDTYKDMVKDSGIQAIDAELISLKNVIEGTEDDIRTEITKAGGFATNSQVLALTNARNKQLIKNYNTLLETRNSQREYLNTMMGLEAQDRARADARMDQMFNFAFKIADYGFRMRKEAVNSHQWLATQPGGFEALQSLSASDPYAAKLINKTFGVGGLQTLADYAAQKRVQDEEERLLGLQAKREQIKTSQAQRAKIYSNIAGGGGGKPVSGSIALQIADSKAAKEMLVSLKKTITTKGKLFGPIVGRLGGWDPYNVEAQDVQSSIDATKQIVGKYLEGGVLRKEDEAKYGRILPKLSDRPEVAKRKLDNVNALVNAKIDAQSATLTASGYNPALTPSGNETIVGPDGLEYEIID